MTCTPHDKALAAASAALDKHGRDVCILDVGDIISITELFVVAHGTNRRQVRTIVDEVERVLRDRCGTRPRSREGTDESGWVLLDFGDIVVHVFLEETREHFGLDRLWADAPRVPVPEPGAAATA